MKMILDTGKTLQDQYKSAFGAELGTGMANALVSAAMEGRLQEFVNSNANNPAAVKAAELFVGAAEMAQSGLKGALKAMPGGEETLNFMEAGELIAEFVPAAQRPKFMMNLTKNLSDAGFPILQMSDPWWKLGGPQITLPKEKPAENPADRAALDRADQAATGITPPARAGTPAGNAVDLNSMTTAQLAEHRYGQGKITFEDLKGIVGAREAARIKNAGGKK
jgi:hypothetical protein